MEPNGTRLYAATGDAVARLDGPHGWEVELSLVGSGVQCLAIDPTDPDVLYAGLRDGGVQRSPDAGASWSDCALPAPAVYSVAVAADGAVYAGTEPSALFRSDDGGQSWRELASLLDLPSQPTWSFPPRPWTSHVRWIAPCPHEPEVLLVGIELGGLMRSTDGGETWDDHRPGAQRDVHSLAWHPRAPGRAYEAGGGGAAWSDDAGDTWSAADEGRDRHYTWSVAVDPLDPELWYVSASTGPNAAHGRGDAQARIFRKGAGGWAALGGGLPDPLPMPYALVASGGVLYAGLASGELWQSADRGDSWARCRSADRSTGSSRSSPADVRVPVERPTGREPLRPGVDVRGVNRPEHRRRCGVAGRIDRSLVLRGSCARDAAGRRSPAESRAQRAQAPGCRRADRLRRGESDPAAEVEVSNWVTCGYGMTAPSSSFLERY